MEYYERVIHNGGLDCAVNLWRNVIAVEHPNIKVSEHAELKRILPSNTPFPGPWRNERTPYSVEIMDNLSLYSNIQHTIFMKPAQIGATAIAENGNAYWMDVFPSDILHITATEELLLRWETKRFEPLIDSYNLRSKIFAQNSSKASKRSGDRTFSKEFLGGSWTGCSAGSPASIRSDSIKIMFRDEMSAARRMLVTGEGRFDDVSLARTFGYGDRRRVFDFSTPTVYGQCLITELYESGDQRKYYVPCPHCGVFQILEWGHGFGFDDPSIGMQWEIIDGQVKRAWYVCPHCHGEILQRHKREMLTAGYWQPTATSYADYVRSYHINGLYSPIGMLSWREMVIRYLKAQDSPEGMRSFVNLYLGLPYRETGARPDWTKVIELRGNYRAGAVPDGVIFLTASVDVQRGSEKEGEKPARLEMEVCGHGVGYRSWSIEHKVFEGPVDNEHEGAWRDLAEYWQKTAMTYTRRDGARFQIQRVLVDSGDNTSTVYAFCGQWNAIFPSKGMTTIKPRKDEPPDQEMNRSIRRFRVARLEGGQVLVEVNTVFYKRQVYTNIKIKRKFESVQQPANFCDFPIDYSEEYFKQLTAEDMVIDSVTGEVKFRGSRARPNEALDLRVLNLCARDQFLDTVVNWLKAEAKNKGYTADALDTINSKTALDWLGRSIKAVKKKT